tara:strand:- start:68 stop:1111 length:1044 start_codon:yes stop_codon:yes gene_type:complete
MEDPEYELLSLLTRPQNEVDWGDIISEIYECQQDSETYAEHFSKKSNTLLAHIAHMEASISSQIERLAATEFLALSYYSHFENLDPTEIVGNSTILVPVLDYELEFEVFRTKKGGEIPAGSYTPPGQNEYVSTYSLRIARINDTDIQFDRGQIEASAELIELHTKGSQSIEACIEVMKQRFADSTDINFGFYFDYKLPITHQLWTELSEIFNGKRGILAKDLLICTMYRFEHLDVIEPLLDSSRAKSFQFLRQIVSDLKGNVTPIREGLLVESLTGNCYQIERTKFKFLEDNYVVFWAVHEIYTNEFICIDVHNPGIRLPPGDYLAALVLSLYDDHESSHLIHTLAN